MQRRDFLTDGTSLLVATMLPAYPQAAGLEEGVSAALAEFRALPLWTRLKFGDLPAEERILVGLRRLARFDAETLREVIRIGTCDRPDSQVAGFELGLNGTLLCRFYLAAPLRYGLWPLGARPDGRLYLAHRYGGVGASLPDPRVEFDHLRKKYGVRARIGWCDDTAV